MSGGLALVQVPYVIGDERHPASEGPKRLVAAAGERALAAGRVAVTVDRVERGGTFVDSASASLAVNRKLARAVGGALERGRVPVVLAGSCDASLGLLGGFDHRRCGVVWIDAHADFNTPETTVTGFFPGMAAAVIAGHCYRSYWAEIGDAAPVPEAAILMLGVRDFSPEAERARLESSDVHVVAWRDGEPDGDLVGSVDELETRVDEVYLHFDLDALDPDVGPGVVDAPVPGGLSLGDAEDVLRAVSARFPLKAAAVTTYNPARDEDEKTLSAALRILALLDEWATSTA